MKRLIPFLLLSVAIIIVAIFVVKTSSKTTQQQPSTTGTPAQQTTASTLKPTSSFAVRTAPNSTPSIRINALGNRPVPPADFANEPWKLREEWRQLSVSFLEIGNTFRQTGALPSEIEFPLFDGNTVTLTNFKFVPQNAPNKGVFFARVKGESVGGHVMFSYVNNATVGAIHIPSRNTYYEINNATPDNGPVSQIYLAQIDPAKLPACGVCAEHALGEKSAPDTPSP